LILARKHAIGLPSSEKNEPPVSKQLSCHWCSRRRSNAGRSRKCTSEIGRSPTAQLREKAGEGYLESLPVCAAREAAYFSNMKIIANRKWMIRDRALAARLRAWLVAHGAEEEKVTGKYEAWRVKQSDAKWTYYTTGTLYVTDSEDPALLEAQRHVDALLGGRFAEPTRDFQIGLDETGKGEIFGPVVLAAVVAPRELFGQLEEVLGVADTKVKHSAAHWEELLGRIGFYQPQGLAWKTRKIVPEEFDRVSVNRLMDRDYRLLLEDITAGVTPAKTRVVLDDYGPGRELDRYFAHLREAGMEVVRTTKADDRYLECRLASLVAKGEQQRILEAIRRDKRYALKGQELGSGNAGDRKTLGWLRAWHRTGRPWPEFVKQSFRTVQEIDGRTALPKRKWL
jgi:ribonuclease HII